MSFARYENYKDSGVEWLPQLPGHWRTGSLRWLSRRFSGGTPDKNTQEYWEDGTIPWLNSGAVNQALITEPSTYITAAAFENSSAKWIPAEALVMALAGQGKTKGMVAQLAIPSTCNQSMAAIVPTAELNARFLLWWLQSNYQNIRNMAGGDMRDGLNLDLLGEIPCPIPPPVDQAAIATFLDHETAKIDALVAEQERLIALLAEKRQAVISHAVTKGLDPTAPMKSSGIDWLGNIPAHWEAKRLRFLCQIETGDGDTADANDDAEYPFFVRSQTIEHIDRYAHDCEAVLTAGDGAGVGKVFHHYKGKFCAHQRVYIFKDFQSISARFFFHYMREMFMRLVLEGTAKSTVDSLRRPMIADFVMTVPPENEQSLIIEHVETHADKFDLLIAESSKTIEILQERRTALISAAVTGKIDVRGKARKEKAA
jgi:type I restriction enzyme, S subunit